MGRNTGKNSEKEFENSFRKYGKGAYIHRFVDASEIKGKTGKVAIAASPQPSDYIVTLDGETFFAEVKSTTNVTSFPFSLLAPQQTAMATMIVAAGGDYRIFAHSLVKNRWYMIPFNLVEKTKAEGKSSIKWEDLSHCEWKT